MSQQEQNPPPRRKHLMGVLALIFVLAGAGYAVYWAMHARYHQTTDDAYVGGNLVQINARVAGTVIAVNADDTQSVKEGETVVKLDDTDAAVALESAKAGLAQAVRHVRQLFENVDQYQAALDVQQEVLRQAKLDLTRREGLLPSNAVSSEEVEHAQATVKRATASVQLAAAQLAGAKSQVSNTTVESHPAVKQAEAHLREAYLAWRRTQVRAPLAGFIAKRNVQVGQQIVPGTPLMVVVPLSGLWVDAHFKEDQLAKLRIGQPVILHSDVYGRSVDFHGKVMGFAPGTGSVFALLPPQNASGNWIKIVQRLPVRIAMDEKELAQYPLRVGLSMEVDVETRNKNGAALVAPVNETRYSTNIFDGDEKAADVLVKQVLNENLPGKN